MFSLLFLLILLAMGASTLWMAIDAARLKIPITKGSYDINNGALAWFGSAILLWIVTFPYYLMRRGAVLQERQNLSSTPKIVPPIASPGGENER